MLNKIRENKLFFLYIIILIPFFKLSFLLNNKYIYILYAFIELLSILIILYHIIKTKKFKFSKIIVYISVYCILLIFSSVINELSIKDSILTSIKTLMRCIIVEIGMKYDKKTFFKSMSFLSCSLIYINSVSVLFSETENWVLGNQNNFIVYMFPAIMSSFIYSYLKYNKLKKKDYILLTVCFFTLLKVRSMTSLICISIIIIYVFFFRLFKEKQFLNIKNYFISYIILFFSIVFFRIQNIFRFFVEKVFKKNVTLTGRTILWDKCMIFIKEKLFLGYGMETDEVMRQKINYVTFHDQILETIYKSGIVGLILYLLILIKSIKKLYMKRNFEIAKLLSIIIFSILIRLIVETSYLDKFLFMFVIIYNIDLIIEEKMINNSIC